MGKPRKKTANRRNAGAAETAAVLAALSRNDAFARIEGRIVRLFARSHGVTLAIGAAKIAVLRALVAADALAEERLASGSRFVLTEAGRARLRGASTEEGNGFASQHAEHERIACEGAEDGHVIRNAAESPLLWLYRRGGGLIGEAEFAAGERLRSDMTLARTLPRLTANLERPSRSGVAIGLDPSEARVAAVQRVQTALRAVGPELSGVLMDVCGFLKSLDAVERERGWPQRSAKLALSLGLAALARHYGFGNLAVGRAGRRRNHNWHAEATRPEFSLPAEEAGAA